MGTEGVSSLHPTRTLLVQEIRPSRDVDSVCDSLDSRLPTDGWSKEVSAGRLEENLSVDATHETTVRVSIEFRHFCRLLIVYPSPPINPFNLQILPRSKLLVLYLTQILIP